MLDTDNSNIDSPDTPAPDDAAASDAPAPRKRAPRKTAAKAAAAVPADTGEASDATPAPRKRTPRKATAKATTPTPAPAAEQPATGDAEPAKKAPRKRASKAAASTAETPTAEGVVTETPAAASADPSVAADPSSTEPLFAAAPAKRAPRKRAAKKVAEPAETPRTDSGSPDTDSSATESSDSGAAAAAGAGSESGAPGVLFVAPQTEPAPRRRRAAKKAAGAPAAADGADATADTSSTADDTDTSATADSTEGNEADPDDVREAAIEQANGARRRRRRGRRGRGGANRSDDAESTDPESTDGGSADDSDDASADDESDASDTDKSADDAGDEGSSSSRRRRRRRRSGSGGGGDDADGTDDPPNTVTHVRDKKDKKDKGDDDGVRGIKGSTRLEAKRQRRRDGRETGRRRAPILTEAEFLARREAVDRVMAVRQQGDRTQIAVLEDDILVEHYVTRASATSYVGNVYLGRVQNVLPSMEAAFVDIGKNRNGVLYAGEVNWDAAGLDGKSRTIEHAMKGGDSVLVQVTKDPIGHKGARLTSQVSLPGRFLVYVPGGGMTGISRRLPDTERHRLKAILKKIVPDEAGVIVRTAAEGASEQDLTHDVERLQAQWESIQQQADSAKNGASPKLLHGEPDLAVRVVRDVFNEDFGKLVVEGDDAWTTVSDYVGTVAPDLAERVSKHAGDGDLFHTLRVDEQLAKALDRKVWLPSGGSLVIDRTEAMTVVDVNTGKFVGSGGNLEQTVTRNNLEAAEEIVRQLRLRDVGGIVVIDFIDMVLESNRDLVLRRLTECLGRDRTKHQVAEVTSLGLVQMTRKRVGEGLLEAFSEPCEHCHGRGVIVHGEPVDKSSSPDADDDDRSSNGRNKRGRRGSKGSSEPTPVEPAATSEQRQAANAAIAAIHRATEANGSNGAESGGSLATLATDLVNAAMNDAKRETPAEAVPGSDAAPESDATPGSGAETSAGAKAGKDQPAPVAAEQPAQSVEPVGPADAGTPETSPQPAAAGSDGPTADEPTADEPTADESNAAPVRRRRRAASRPAGPPVHA